MSKRPWFKCFPADFLHGMAGLTSDERNVYVTLVFEMYDNGGPIKLSPKRQAHACSLSTRKFNEVLETLTQEGKFQQDGECISNKRAMVELQKNEKEHESLSESAKKSHENRTGKPNENSEDTGNRQQPNEDLASAVQKPEARSQKPEAERQLEKKEEAALAVRTGQQITDLMGVTNDPRWLGNWSLVHGWMAEGFDPEIDILPTVREIVERLKRSGRPMPGTLSYFTKAIRENHRIRQGSGVSPVAPNQEFVEVTAGTPAFKAWLRHWGQQGRKTTWLQQQRSITVKTEYPQPVDTRVSSLPMDKPEAA